MRRDQQKVMLVHPLYCLSFILAYTTLCNVFIFRAEFEDPFNTFTNDSIHWGPTDIVHSYWGKIMALLEKQIQEGVDKQNAEMQTLQTDLLNFESVFFRMVGKQF